jgi:hypothetical protein
MAKFIEPNFHCPCPPSMSSVATETPEALARNTAEGTVSCVSQLSESVKGPSSRSLTESGRSDRRKQLIYKGSDQAADDPDTQVQPKLPNQTADPARTVS